MHPGARARVHLGSGALTKSPDALSTAQAAFIGRETPKFRSNLGGEMLEAQLRGPKGGASIIRIGFGGTSEDHLI